MGGMGAGGAAGLAGLGGLDGLAGMGGMGGMGMPGGNMDGLMSDPAAMEQMTAMMQDPAVQQMMQDPNTIRAIMAQVRHSAWRVGVCGRGFLDWG